MFLILWLKLFLNSTSRWLQKLSRYQLQTKIRILRDPVIGSLSGYIFSRQTIKLWIKVLVYSNLIPLLGLVLSVFLVAGVNSFIIPYLGVNHWLWSYLPSSSFWLFLASLATGLSSLWVTLVSFNHFSDVWSIFTDLSQAGHGWYYFIPNVCGYVWVTTYVMWSQFIKTLWTDPSHLATTQVYLELVSLWLSLGQLSSSGLDYIHSHLPTYIYDPLYNLGLILIYPFGWCGSQISSFTVWIFTSYITWITSLITPEVWPWFQPTVDSMARSAAYSIGIAGLLWIIKFILGLL